METSLFMNSRNKHLCLLAKKQFITDNDISLKLRGLLDTVSSSNQIDAVLMKFFRIGKAPRFSEDDVYQQDQRVRLGVGIASGVSSPAGGIFPTDEVFLKITGKQKFTVSKQSDIIRGRQVLRNYSQAKFKASYDYNVRTEKWSGKASASLSHAMFRFAEDQDVRITAGYQTSINSYGLTEPKPFVRIEENCWRFESDFNGSWYVRYAL